MVNLRAAKMRIRETGGNFVCLRLAPSGEEKLYESNDKGLEPILKKMDIRKNYFKEAYVADRIVGKAAAMLLVASGVRGIYADIMGADAKKFLETVMYDRTMGRNNSKLVEFEAKTTVPFINNGTSALLCDYEKAVENVERYDEAYGILRKQFPARMSSENS